VCVRMVSGCVVYGEYVSDDCVCVVCVCGMCSAKNALF